jgi:hypothetical protein
MKNKINKEKAELKAVLNHISCCLEESDSTTFDIDEYYSNVGNLFAELEKYYNFSRNGSVLIIKKK